MLRWLYTHLIFWPFFTLYLHGPRLAGYGFWAGKPAVDICSTITGAPSHLWVQNQDACMALLYREAEAILISLTVVLWFYFLINLWLFLQALLYLRLQIMCGMHARAQAAQLSGA